MCNRFFFSRKNCQDLSTDKKIWSSKIIVQGIFDLLKLVLVAQVLPGTIKECFDNQKNVFLHTFIIEFVKVQPPRLFKRWPRTYYYNSVEKVVLKNKYYCMKQWRFFFRNRVGASWLANELFLLIRMLAYEVN